ncbi:MAG TPA: hypothetical protein DCZ43_03165 [candidate division Zixibacteria bacterium]|nr:hypothetical protein [candidate division Zixibacteria bacterium]
MKVFTTAKSILLLSILAALLVSCNNEVKQLTIRITSRMYSKFEEEHTVKMYQKFPISDTDLEGVVVEFYPDFDLDTLTFKAYSRSDTLYNPAAKILLIKGKDKKEEAWAFLPGMVPHFSPRSFLGFELLNFKTGGKYIKPVNPRAENENDNEK